MTEKPWAERTEEEQYGHPPGGFNWQVERLELTGFAVGTVRPWARDEEWRRFQAREGRAWWWYWGPSTIDGVGCRIPEYLERDSNPAAR